MKEKIIFSPPVRWAWLVLEAHFQQRKAHMPDDELLKQKGACFVSLHNADGSLRGCIGTILSTRNSLKEEIENNALSAAFQDPRFPPLKESELETLDISVDVLSNPEPVHSFEMLDAKKYGVIVSAGYRRGVLLPDLEGVDTIEQQLHIAMQKAGIKFQTPIQVERFYVKRYH